MITPRHILTAVSIFFIVFNAPGVYRQWRHATADNAAGASEPGYRFTDLRVALHGIDRAGYLTDRDLSPESVATGELLSAQYQLAPTVLQANKIAKRNVLDFDDRQKAAETVRAAGLEELVTNPHGITVAGHR